MSSATSDVMQLFATMIERRVRYREDMRKLGGGLPASGCGDVDLLLREGARSWPCSSARDALGLTI